MKRNDCILAAILLFLSFAVSLFTYIRGYSRDASIVVVAIDGEVYGTYSLYEDREIVIDNGYGHNLIRISEGRVHISESDCEGGDCLAMGHISKSGERIVCLPHRLEIYIKGGEEDVDTVAY